MKEFRVAIDAALIFSVKAESEADAKSKAVQMLVEVKAHEGFDVNAMDGDNGDAVCYPNNSKIGRLFDESQITIEDEMEVEDES